MKKSATTSVSAILLVGFTQAIAGAPGESLPRPRIETGVSPTANLVHWIDNLAQTSVAKTQHVYQSYWRERFGPLAPEYRAALESFARIRRKTTVPLPAATATNESGCLPMQPPTLTWHQVFLAESMKAASIDDLRKALSTYLDEAELEELAFALELFRPQFESVWKEMGHVQRFQKRFRKFLEKGELLDYLGVVADFLGVDPRQAPSMKISFIGLPSNGPTHAEADGEFLLVEIRPLDRPEDQIQVVAHEGTHFFMRLMSAEQLDRLARQAYEEAEAGALVWRYLWEGLPTALGQGLAEARVGSGLVSDDSRWYHIEAIDRFAKLIYPAVADATARSEGIEDGLMRRITRALQASALVREAPTARFLTPAFFATGEGMEPGMELLRRRLGLGGNLPGTAFDLDDPEAGDLLRRYSCLGGIALVSPRELQKAAAIDGVPLLAPGLVEAARERAETSLGVIAAGRREGGGTVYFLISPDRRSLPRLIETFAGLRGVPDEPIVVSGNPPIPPRGSP